MPRSQMNRFTRTFLKKFTIIMCYYLNRILETLALLWIFTIGGIASLVYKYKISNRSNQSENSEGDLESVENEVIIITGAQRGIGKALSIEFAKRNGIVVLGCVDMDVGKKTQAEIKSATGNQNIDLIYLDLSEMSSVRKFAATVQEKYPKVKILINNAGLGGAPNGNVKTIDGFNLHLSVNYLGHFLLTNLLLPNMKSGSRVICISSTLQLLSQLDLNDFMMDKSDFMLGFDTGLPYANSKFALSLFMKELGRRVEGSGVTTYSVCPGIVRTEIYQSAAFALRVLANWTGFTPEEACEGILYCALNSNLRKESGNMYRFKNLYLEANARLDPTLARQLWDLSAKLVKL